MTSPEQVVSVEIGGLNYPIRTGLDTDYVLKIAAYVNERGPNKFLFNTI